MNKQETLKILTVLKAVYPNFCKSQDSTNIIADLWADFLKSQDYIVVDKAVKNLIKTRVSTFDLAFGELQEQIDLILPGESDAELWTALKKACCNGLYGAVKEYERLPEVCQKWLGGPSALKDLAMIESRILDTVVRGEFLKSIPALKARNEVQKSLPAEVRAAIESANLKLLGGYDD